MFNNAVSILFIIILMDEIISTEERDSIFKDLLLNKENTLCFDCSSKNPKWASVNLGLFICFDCSGRHRSYGTNISFVRSIDLDKWKRGQIENMKNAGNKYAKMRFEELGIDKEGKIYNYKNSSLDKYRDELLTKVKSLFKSTVKEVKKETIQEIKKDIPKPKDEEEFFESNKVHIEEKKEKETKPKKKAKDKGIKEVDFDFDWDDEIDYVTKVQPKKDSKPLNKRDDDEIDFEEDDKVEKLSQVKAKKLEEMKNKKAISSDDFLDDKDDYSSNKQKKQILSQMKNATAISSDDLNGVQKQESKLLCI